MSYHYVEKSIINKAQENFSLMNETDEKLPNLKLPYTSDENACNLTAEPKTRK